MYIYKYNFISGIEVLNEILKSHRVLATCYAMKEEMNRLFELRDRDEAYYGWTKWFTAAKESGIPQLQKFAELKEKRLKGLVAHATHPISTGKLEGMNNKIKVAKRIAYGYRDEDYFFRLIRYQSSLSIQKKSVKSQFFKNSLRQLKFLETFSMSLNILLNSV